MKLWFWWLLICGLLLPVYAIGQGFDEAQFIADEQDALGEKSNKEKQQILFHGSFENQFTLLVAPSEAQRNMRVIYNYLQLRLDMDVALKSGIELKSDVIARLFAGDTSIYLNEIIPPRVTSSLLREDPRFFGVLHSAYTYDDQYYVDNLYMKLPVGEFLITLGKQPLAQGAGYVWNPTDPFTVKELLDPTYHKEGSIAVKLSVPLGDGLLDLMAAPDGAFRHWTAGGRAVLVLDFFSISFVSYYTRTKRIDMHYSMDAMEQASLNDQSSQDAIIADDYKRILVGGDIVFDFKGVRLWSEGAYNWVSNAHNWFEITNGLEYYFPFETHIMVEYFHYGLGGAQSGGMYDFNEWINVLEGHLKMLGQDFLFESIEHPVWNYWSMALSSFQSISDGSAMFEADIRWEFSQGAKLWLMAAKSIGARDDFFASSFQSWLRLQLFF